METLFKFKYRGYIFHYGFKLFPDDFEWTYIFAFTCNGFLLKGKPLQIFIPVRNVMVKGKKVSAFSHGYSLNKACLGQPENLDKDPTNADFIAIIDRIIEDEADIRRV